MNKRSNKISLIICGVAFCVMIWYMVFVDGVDNLTNSISQINGGFLLLSVLFMVIYWLLEAGTLQLALKSIYPEQRFKNTVTITIIGQYFNCITPCASGGQPFQAYYLVKSGAPLGSSMTALLARFIVYQFVLTLLSALLLILRFSYFIAELKPLMLLVIVGFLVNLAVIIGLVMLAFFKNTATKIAHWTLKFLNKLHLIKNYEEKLKFIDEEMKQYSENFIFLKSKPKLIIKILMLSIFQLLFYFSISYVLYLGFGLSGVDFLTIISCQAFVLMISSFVPLPGALGAAEGSYAAFFVAIFGDFVVLSTFIWRFLTFYLPIIAGLIATLCLSRKYSADSSPNEKKAVSKL